MLSLGWLTPGRKKLAANTANFTVSRFITLATRFVYLILVARLLDQQLYGQLAYAQSWYLAFFPIALFGLPTTVKRSIAFNRAEADRRVALASALRWLVLAVATLSCVLFAWLFESNSELLVVMLVFSLAIAGRATVSWFESILLAHQLSSHSLKAALFFRPVELLFAVIVLLAGGSILHLALVHGFVWISQSLWLGAQAAKLITIPKSNWNIRGIWETALVCLPIFGMALTSSWMTQGALILYRHSNAPEMGSFAILIQLLVTLSMLPLAVTQSLLPALTRAFLRSDSKDYLYERYARRVILGLGGIVAAFAAWLGPVLVPLILGDNYQIAGDFLGVALLVLAVVSVAIIQQQVLIARGKHWPGMVISFVSLLLMLVVWQLLSDSMGIAEMFVVMGCGIGARMLFMS
ncbi:MAG: oligosaccharide flippase family protein, partial [Chromatiales bacterium]